MDKIRQPTKWEKIFEDLMTDKGLTLNIHKQLRQLTTKKQNNTTTTQSKVCRGTKQTFF